jgi:hypothetical protein
MRITLALLVMAQACDPAPKAALDSGGRDVEVGDGADGDPSDDGADGADGADDTSPEYTAFDGFLTQDVAGPGSDTPDLCQLVWLTTGRPASSTCDGCVWSFLVSGTYDPALSEPGACGEPSPFTITWATDGETLFYEYGGGFSPFSPVDTWTPGGTDYNFAASTARTDGDYTTTLLAGARVR